MTTTKQYYFDRFLAGSLAILQLTFGIPFLVGTSEAEAAGTEPRVWVAPVRARRGGAGGDLIAKKFDEVARGQLNRSERIEMAGQGIQGPIQAGDSDPRLEQAERLRVAGKEAYAAGDHEVAVKRLVAALDGYEKSLPSLIKFEALLETLGFLGAASLGAGFDADAKDYFKRVWVLAPDAEPLDEYQPAAQAFFRKVTKKLKKKAAKKRGGIKIITKPRGATVEVDGIEKGSSPARISGLPTGFHYVRATHPEAGLAALKVKVKKRKMTTVKLELKTVLGEDGPGDADEGDVQTLMSGLEQNRLDAQFAAAAESISKQTQCDYVVVGEIEQDGQRFIFNGFVYGTGEKEVAALKPLKFRAELASALIQAAQFAQAVEETANNFPFDRVLKGNQFVARALPPVASASSAAVGPPARTGAPPPTSRAAPPRSVLVTPSSVVARTEVIDDLPPPAIDKNRWYNSWWFWTATGAVIIAGASVGGYFLFNEDDASTAYDAEVNW